MKRNLVLELSTRELNRELCMELSILYTETSWSVLFYFLLQLQDLRVS